MRRVGSNNAKWNFLINKNITPFTVAESEFKAPKALRKRIKKINRKGIFGYTIIADNFYKSIIRWYKYRHFQNLQKEEILFVPRILQGINILLSILIKKNDRVLLLSPYYSHLKDSILNQGGKCIEYQLFFENNSFKINFIDIEKLIKSNNIRVLILTNPHNPTGKIWRKDEIRTIIELAKKYNFFIISDEIHSDIISSNIQFTSILNFSDIFQNFAIFNSPAKTFNCAGLQSSYAIIKNNSIKEKLEVELKKNMIHAPNIFAIEAINQCYLHSDKYYKKTLKKIFKNYNYIKKIVQLELPSITLIPLEGTFLALLDFSKLNLSEKVINEKLQSICKIKLTPGSEFGIKDHIIFRLNFSCPKPMLKKALKSLKKI